MKKLLVVVMLTSMVLFSVGCEKNNVDTEQNTTVEDSGNKDTSETQFFLTSILRSNYQHK